MHALSASAVGVDLNRSGLPTGVRVGEVRAMLRSAGAQGLSVRSVEGRFGLREAVGVLAALQAEGLVAPHLIGGRHALTDLARAWLVGASAKTYRSDSARRAVRDLLRRVRELNALPTALFVPQRVLLKNDVPAGGSHIGRVQVGVALRLNEVGRDRVRAAAFSPSSGGIQTRLSEQAWTATRGKTTMRYLSGGTPLLSVHLLSADTEGGGREIFPKVEVDWLEG